MYVEEQRRLRSGARTQRHRDRSSDVRALRRQADTTCLCARPHLRIERVEEKEVIQSFKSRPTHHTLDEQHSCLPEGAVGVTHGLIAPLRLGGREGQLSTKLEHRGQDGVDDVHHRLCLFA